MGAVAACERQRERHPRLGGRPIIHVNQDIRDRHVPASITRPTPQYRTEIGDAGRASP